MNLLQISNKAFFSRKLKFHPGKFPENKNRRVPKKIIKTTTTNIETGSLIPKQKLSNEAFLFFAFNSRSFISKRKFIIERTEILQNMKKQYPKVDISDMENKFRSIIKWINFEQKLRFSFLRLLFVWRQKRYCNRILNTEDPITMCPPSQPIYIFDNKAKGYFLYDAKTLKKSMESNLFFNDWLFPEPQCPKNILTNIPFSGAQIIKIIYYLRSYGLGSWSLEAFNKCEWNIEKFTEIYTIPLKIEALKDIIRNKNSVEFKTLLREFIEDEYDTLYEDNFTKIQTILWAIDNEPNSNYVQKWIRLFERYYTLDFVCGSIFTGLNRIKENAIHLESKMLFLDKKETIKIFARKRAMERSQIQQVIESSDSETTDSTDSFSDIIEFVPRNTVVPLSSIPLGVLLNITSEDGEIIIYGEA